MYPICCTASPKGTEKAWISWGCQKSVQAPPWGEAYCQVIFPYRFINGTLYFVSSCFLLTWFRGLRKNWGISLPSLSVVGGLKRGFSHASHIPWLNSWVSGMDLKVHKLDHFVVATYLFCNCLGYVIGKHTAKI